MLLLSLLPSLALVTAQGHSPELLLVPKDTLAPVTVPVKIWASTRQAVLRPTTRDLRKDALFSLMGSHFDQDWMSVDKPTGPPKDLGNMNRSSVRNLRKMTDEFPLRDSLKEWLISQATCPVKYIWKDLGEEFWPRYLRAAECLDHPIGTCSWPPGMRCLPAPPRHLHVLRWHCRLRKNSKKSKKSSPENNVLILPIEPSPLEPKGNKKKRKRYRCMWIKVPYPIAEDCICGCDVPLS